MNTLKYILIKLEFIAFAISVILGIGAAESKEWFAAVLLMFGPYVIAKLLNISKQIEFLEAYDRAYSIKIKKAH